LTVLITDLPDFTNATIATTAIVTAHLSLFADRHAVRNALIAFVATEALWTVGAWHRV